MVYKTKLYLIKTRVVWYLDLGRPSHMTSREFFSQLVIRGFSHFPLITLDPAVPLHPLLVRALDRCWLRVGSLSNREISGKKAVGHQRMAPKMSLPRYIDHIVIDL